MIWLEMGDPKAPASDPSPGLDRDLDKNTIQTHRESGEDGVPSPEEAAYAMYEALTDPFDEAVLRSQEAEGQSVAQGWAERSRELAALRPVLLGVPAADGRDAGEASNAGVGWDLVDRESAAMAARRRETEAPQLCSCPDCAPDRAPRGRREVGMEAER